MISVRGRLSPFPCYGTQTTSRRSRLLTTRSQRNPAHQSRQRLPCSPVEQALGSAVALLLPTGRMANDGKLQRFGPHNTRFAGLPDPGGDLSEGSLRPNMLQRHTPLPPYYHKSTALSASKRRMKLALTHTVAERRNGREAHGQAHARLALSHATPEHPCEPRSPRSLHHLGRGQTYSNTCHVRLVPNTAIVAFADARRAIATHKYVLRKSCVPRSPSCLAVASMRHIQQMCQSSTNAMMLLLEKV